MKAVRHRETHIVHHFVDAASIDQDGLHGDVRALDIVPATHELLDANPPSTPFVGGLMMLDDNGVWAIADETSYARAIAPPASAIVAERERRLAEGFEFDFQDARGVHRIGTSEADMRGWDEVSKLAAALIAANVPATEITIVTETGPAVITAAEWQQVLIAAGQFRQPIWGASFALQAADPIPFDYQDDAYWP